MADDTSKTKIITKSEAGVDKSMQRHSYNSCIVKISKIKQDLIFVILLAEEQVVWYTFI